MINSPLLNPSSFVSLHNSSAKVISFHGVALMLIRNKIKSSSSTDAFRGSGLQFTVSDPELLCESQASLHLAVVVKTKPLHSVSKIFQFLTFQGAHF